MCHTMTKTKYFERQEEKESKYHCWAKKKYDDCPTQASYGRCKNCKHYKEIEL